jgi:iron complex transport system ATP-binding protein
MIRLSHVSFIREENRILTDVNWEIRKGEQWALLGRNGSGKTTLLEIVTGYEFPSKGRVEVLGEVYGQVDLREMRKRIGYIGQSLLEKFTLRDPLWEVVATGAFANLRFYQKVDPQVKELALERLRQVGLERLKDHPLGTLSQGERKKALLARTMMSNPELVILDEPCSGLDLFQRENFLETLEEIAKESTIIYVTHHLEEIIPAITHTALIKDGSFISVGRKQEVLTEENIQAAFDVPVRITWEEDRPWVRVRHT